MRGFIEELRYRNVFRVAIAYVVAGWLVAQVADLAADAFNAPEWLRIHARAVASTALR
jgi:adenylate cyclase